MVEKLNETKVADILEKMNKICKTLARMTKSKKRRHTINIRNEISLFHYKSHYNITINLNTIKEIIRKHCKQLYIHKCNNLKELDQFLKNHKLSETQTEQIDIWTVLEALRKLNSQFKISWEKKSPGPKNYSGKFYQTFK